MSLERIEELLAGQRPQPPVERWHPPLSGVIDIRIDAQGRWFHEGIEIQRKALVNLFAGILRREDDGDYYLVTPVEKWRIQVEDTPFLVVGFEVTQRDGECCILLHHNIERSVWLDSEHPLVLSSFDGVEVPRQRLDRGLSARLNRATFYQLVELAEPREQMHGGTALMLRSCGLDHVLGWLS